MSIVVWNKGEVALVINQDASRVPQHMKRLRLLARKYKLHLKMVEGPDFDYAVREALSDKHLKRLIVGGGDGSVNKAASLILRLKSKAELAVLPLGTANYYAKSLGIGKKLDRAFDVALGSKTQKRHVCKANNREFLIGVNVGTTSRMFSEVTDEEKQRIGKLAYFRGVFRVLRRTDPPDITVEVHGKKYTYRSTELVVLNQNIQDRIKLLPDISGTEPYFEIITYGIGKSKLSPLFAVSIFVLTFGRNQKYLKRIRATEARIKSRQDLPVAIDGDVLEHLPLHIQLLSTPVSFCTLE